MQNNLQWGEVWKYFIAFNENLSLFGWTFAGLATGFYAGNIYGTVKSIKKYNQKIENQLRKDAEEVVFSDN